MFLARHLTLKSIFLHPGVYRSSNGYLLGAPEVEKILEGVCGQASYKGRGVSNTPRSHFTLQKVFSSHVSHFVLNANFTFCSSRSEKWKSLSPYENIFTWVEHKFITRNLKILSERKKHSIVLWGTLMFALRLNIFLVSRNWLACLVTLNNNFAVFPLDMYVVDKFLCTDKFEAILRRVLKYL